MSGESAAMPGRGASERRPPTGAGVPGLGRVDRWPLGVVLAAALALALPQLRGPIDLRYDAGVYYSVGSALAEGRGYVIPSEPGAAAEIQYPPALPTVAASVQAVVGTADPAVAGHAMRLLYLILTVAYVVASYVLARRYLAPAWSALAALLTTLHAYTVFLSTLMQAELPYALVTTLFFLAVAPRPGRGWRPIATPRPRWLPEILAATAFLFRTAGIALLGAWALDLLSRRRWGRAVLAVAVAAACVGGWQLHVGRAEADRRRDGPAYAYQYAPYQFYNVAYQTNLTYVDPFRPELGLITAPQFAARTAANVRAVLSDIGELVTGDAIWWFGRLPWGESFGERARFWLVSRTGMLIAVLPLVGFVILAYRGVWIVPLTVVASLALMVVTPWPGQFWRYLAPLMPLFTIATAVTLDVAARTLERVLEQRRAPSGGRRFGRAVPLALPATAALLMLAVQLYCLRQAARYLGDVAYQGRDGRPVRYRLLYYDDPWRKHDAAIDWIARHASKESIVVTSTPQWVYLRTGLRSVMPPFEADPARADRLLASVPGHYLILDNLSFVDVSRRYAAPVAARFPERWRLVFPGEPGGSAVYELLDAPQHAAP